jgi:hypothetical protein
MRGPITHVWARRFESRGPPHIGARKRPFEPRIELRLPGVDNRLPCFARALERDEEVELIADDRTAECEADRMPAVFGLRRAGAVVQFLFEPVQRVQALVAKELERLAAEPVGPALGRHLDDAAHGIEFGRRLADVHLEFADRRLRHLQVLLPGVVRHVHAAVGVIEIHLAAVAPAGPDGRRRPASRQVVHAGARQQQRERDGHAVGHREHLDLLLRHDGRDLRLRDFDDRRFARDGQRFLQALHAHRHVAIQLEADRDGEVRDLGVGEPLELRAERVAPGRKTGQAIGAVGLGDRGPNGPAVHVAQRQVDAGQHPALRVAHRAADDAAHVLSSRRRRDPEQTCQGQRRQKTATTRMTRQHETLLRSYSSGAAGLRTGGE